MSDTLGLIDGMKRADAYLRGGVTMFEVEKDWTTDAGLRAVCGVLGRDGRQSHRCGYVAVPEGHALHGLGYHEPTEKIPRAVADDATIGKKSPILAMTAGVDALNGEDIRRSPDVVFDCHGGLTFSGETPSDSVESENEWWFGFDCSHAGDGYIDPPLPDFPNDGPVRSTEYVQADCEALAAQIVSLFPEAVTL